MHLHSTEWLTEVKITKLMPQIVLSYMTQYALVKELCFGNLLLAFFWFFPSSEGNFHIQNNSQITFIIWNISLTYLGYGLVKHQCDLYKIPPPGF